ncbi:MAG: hypothetical protein K0R65_401 [Crocinitomicaceae bacterium]|jgi:uncharacterized protein (DUF885 family)|nr:hypothetical protein [Crocinitomicaceae bacterium]
MKKGWTLLFLPLLLLSCGQKEVKSDTEFDAFKESFIEDMWKQYPGWASSAGYHKYDDQLSVPDEAGRKKELAFAEKNLEKLEEFDPKSLSANNKTDYYMIENQLKSVQWRINEEKSYQWDPSGYNVSGLFAEMLINDYEALEKRLQNLGKRLQKVPAYYEAAQKNIQNPTKEHTDLAIMQSTGGLSVFETDLKAALEKSKLSQAEKDKIAADAAKAVAAIQKYVAWLKTIDHSQARSFRLGKSLYAKKFEFDIQSGYSYNEIYQKALDRKKFLHGKMNELADQLWPKYFGMAEKPADQLVKIKQVIDKISLVHAEPTGFQAAIEKQIPELVQFVKDKDLLYMDPKKPLVVRKEPDYMAGVAGASISAPGPYDKKGNTYYNVGSLSGWGAEEAESYLREYNQYTLQILNIHEAIPGHYAQLVYSNQSPSMIKSLLGNGAMVEGWAVYTELMMLENGYGNNLPELWLMYYKWNLRTVCNTILDISVHTKNMSEKEGLNLLINEAFQQEAEAKGKWKRVTLTSVQLCSYFTGFTEIYDFREELKKKEGSAFNLKKFHEKFLGYGSAPVKYIRELMLAEKD